VDRIGWGAFRPGVWRLRLGLAAAALVAMSLAGAAWWNSRHGGAAANPDEPSFVDIGKVILTPNGEPLHADVRDTRAVLAAPEGTQLQAYGPSGWSASWNNGFQLTGRIDGQWVQVWFSPRWVNLEREYLLEAARVRPAPGPHSGDSPMIVVSAGGFVGSYQPRAVRVTTDGHVLVAKLPIPSEAVVNSVTGEKLDVSKAHRIANLHVNSGSTMCQMEDGQDHTCYGLVNVPPPNVLTCVSDTSLELGSDDTGVSVRLIVEGGIPACQGQPPGHTVDMRENPRIVTTDGMPVVRAFDADGKVMSTGIAGDGSVWVGVVATVGCPCMGGT